LTRRYIHGAARAAQVDVGASQGFAHPVQLLGSRIEDDDDSLPAQQAPERGFRTGTHRRAKKLGIRIRHAAGCDEMKRLAVRRSEMPARRPAQIERFSEHRVEHRPEIAGRGVDCSKHFGGRALSLACLRQLRLQGVDARLHLIKGGLLFAPWLLASGSSCAPPHTRAPQHQPQPVVVAFVQARWLASLRITPRWRTPYGMILSVKAILGQWQLWIEPVDYWGSDRFRRVSLIPVRPGDGRLTEPTAAIQPWRHGLIFMPHSGPGSADLLESKRCTLGTNFGGR